MSKLVSHTVRVVLFRGFTYVHHVGRHTVNLPLSHRLSGASVSFTAQV